MKAVLRGKMASTYTQACKNCGTLYLITNIKLIMRDKDKIDCEVCGAELLSWNGAVMYDAHLIQRADWPKKEN